MEFLRSKIVILGLCLFLFLLFTLFEFNVFQKGSTTDFVSSNQISKPDFKELFSNSTLRFVQNKGQAGSQAKYHVQAAGHTVLFEDDKIRLRRIESQDKQNEILLKFEGANPNPTIKGLQALSGIAHYYKGTTPDKWQTNVPTYGSIIYKELYPGIDMGYIGEGGNLESEFYVSPGADYREISFNYSGIKSKKINDDGALELTTNLGTLVENPPYVFQDIEGDRIEIEAKYIFRENESISFSLGHYDPVYPIVIDPELVFIKTFGNGTDAAWANSVVLDKDGNLLVVGAADRFFPVTDTIVGSNHADGMSNDGLLLKLDGTTGDVIYSALFGGTSLDYFTDLAVDTAGTVFLTGLTSSDDFPLMNPSQMNYGGSTDGFLTILNASGELMQSSYLGGSEKDWGEGIAIDDSSNIYVGGRTASADFPILGGFQQQHNGGASGSPFPSDIFATKFDTTGTMKYSSFLGGSEDDKFESIAVTGEGQATITGHTKSTDFPLMNAYQGNLAGGNTDIIYSRINSEGSGLVYSSYYGGMGFDQGYDIRIDNAGETYICGSSTSQDFPIIGGQSFPEQDISDGVLVKLDTLGQPVYSLRSNLPGSDSFSALAIDDSLTVYPASRYLDTIRVFQKSETDSLHLIYNVPEFGHRFSAVDYSGGYLAFAGRYLGAFRSNNQNHKSTQEFVSEFEVSAGLIRILELFQSSISEDSVLCIIMNIPNDDGLTVDANPSGFITINGVATMLLANAVKFIKIVGSNGDDCIELRRVTMQKFSSLATLADQSLFVLGEGGNDKIIGSREFGNSIWGAEGNDELYGGSKKDKLIAGSGFDFLVGNDGDDELDGTLGINDMLGGEGRDKLIGSKKSGMHGGAGSDKFIFVTNSSRINNDLLVTKSQAPLTLRDSSGIDTLDLTQAQSAITLDISMIDSVQTIDSSGFQVIIEGQLEVVLGSNFDDEITVSPLLDTLQHLDGGDGVDILNYEVEGNESTDDGSIISTPGYANVSYINFETVNLVDNSTPIAIEISSPLQAEVLPNGQIELKWETASEINNKGFEIQRSSTGITFESIGFVRGKANSFSNNKYNTIDKQPLAENYYRYKQIDFDGGFSYSDVVYIRLENDRRDNFLIYPNPNSGEKINIEFDLKEDTNVSIQIYDLNGFVRITNALGVLPEGKHNIGLDQMDLASGIYIIQLSTEEVTYFRKLSIL